MPYAQRQSHAFKKISEQKSMCVACRDHVHLDKAVKLPCKDVYCHDCIKQLFQRSILDKQLFPPRCCRRKISLELAIPAMSDEEVDRFKLAQIEHATSNKVYCSNTECAKFVLPDNIRQNKAICGYCRTSTCIHCKNKTHAGDCPVDAGIQTIIAMSEQEGWQRCHRCHAMIELETGCNHIT